MKLVKLKCEGCGAILKVNEELKKVTCNYCGTEFLVDDEVKRVEITKNINHHNIYTDEAKIKENERKIKELEYKDKGKKRDDIVIFVCFGIMIFWGLFSMGMSFYYEKQSEPDKNELKVPMSANKYKGENYEIVVQQLEDAGFENIESKSINDLVTGWMTKDGEVESVSIAGDTQFEEGEIFSKDSEVVVTYHTFKDKNKDKE